MYEEEIHFGELNT